MSKIWDDWVPGVLSRHQLITMAENGYLTGVAWERDEDVDHSSIDLHLTNEAYHLLHGSFKPHSQASYLQELLSKDLAESFASDASGHFALLPHETYLFALQEGLNFDEQIIREQIFEAQATAKSTIGRVDVLARLVVDGMDTYERYIPPKDPSAVGPTKMYVEITPISFPVLVKAGLAITQLRLFLGRPEDCLIPPSFDIVRACFAEPERANHGTLSVDLSAAEIEGIEACGYCTKEESRSLAAIPLWKVADGHDPARWWRVVQASNGTCKVDVDRFQILRSRERLTLPKGVAVYARATDEEIGEMRIHYAGFVHPNFGTVRSDAKHGTPLIFEVRCHNVKVMLRDSEILARLQFYRMSDDEDLSDYDKEKIYNSKDDPYSTQELNLSKIFSNKWGSRPEVVDGGSDE